MVALYWMLSIGVAIVVLAASFRMLKWTPRRQLRRSVVLYAPYALLNLVTLLPERLRDETWFNVVTAARDLLGALLVINIAALLVFHLGLRLIRLGYPDILHDIAVGVAYIVAAVWLMHRVGVNVASIVATSAVVTAVIGLSLQSTLGNVIGGLALQVDDSVREGDWVEFENKVQGQVKKVRWRHTVIETRDWDTLIVPNGQLLNQTLKVLGKRDGQPVQHRMWVHFGVDFRYAPSDVIRVVDGALQGARIPDVAENPAAHAICFDFARDHKDSFACYAVRYWLTDLARDDPTSSAVRQRIYTALKRAEIPLALPAAALFLAHDDPERTERKRLREQGRVQAALRGVELFQQLSEDELKRLSASVKVAPFAKGEIITRQNARAHWLYVLTKGEVEVRIASDDGQDRRVASVTAPGFFGEMALMTGAAREATVVALNEVECLRVDKDDFRELLARRPEIAQEVSTVLAQRRVELEAVREGLDVGERTSRIMTERTKILASIQDFFGMKS